MHSWRSLACFIALLAYKQQKYAIKMHAVIAVWAWSSTVLQEVAPPMSPNYIIAKVDLEWSF